MTDEMGQLQIKLEQYTHRIKDLEKQMETSQAIFRRLQKDHDLRSTLSQVCGMPLLLLQSSLTPEQRRDVETIRLAGTQLLASVNDYLDLMKTETGQMKVDSFQLDVHETIEGVIKGEAETAKRQDIALTYTIAPNAPVMIVSDRWHIQNILAHLVRYAMSVIHHGVITLIVTLEQSTDESAIPNVNFSVRNNGVYRGPREHNIRWMKEVKTFFDQENIVNIPAGVDIGLIVSRRLSDLLGGTIRVENDVEGDSMTIHFRLPCEVIPQFEGRIIAVVGGQFGDQRFCHKLLAMCQNTREAWIGEMMISRYGTISPYLITAPLLFNVNPQPVRFLQDHRLDEYKLKTYLFSQSQGIVVSLSGRTLDVEFLASHDLSVISLKDVLEVVYKADQPTIVVVEDIRGQPVEIEMPEEIEYIEEGISVVKVTKEQPSRYFSLEDDIWQPESPTMKGIRQALEIPESIPLLPYSHDKPVSIENILTTLFEKIEHT